MYNDCIVHLLIQNVELHCIPKKNPQPSRIYNVALSITIILSKALSNSYNYHVLMAIAFPRLLQVVGVSFVQRQLVHGPTRTQETH